jgi:thioredoxin 1
MKLLGIILFAGVVLSCESPKGLRIMKADLFQKEIDQTEDKLIIDVRTPDEFMGGHLDDAVNLTFNSTDFESEISALDHESTVFVYCLSGGRSHSAALKMIKLGFNNVVELDGGMMSWRASKLPESKAASRGFGKQMTIAELEAEISSHDQVLLDFYATWCGPCKKLKPELQTVEKHYKGKLKVIRIDVDKESLLAEELGIVNIPTLVYYKDNDYKWKILGFKNAQELITKIDSGK